MTRPRRAAGKQSLKRRAGTRRPRRTFLIFCEGERTEPEYLAVLKRQPVVHDIASVELSVVPGDGSSKPQKLVSLAIEARQRAIKENSEIDEFWCVFDVEWPENHAGLRKAIAEARHNEIGTAVSNPCFELWLILHFKDRSAWLDNDQACALRRRLDGSLDKRVDGARYMPLVADAARRAEALDLRHQREGAAFPQDNPSSGMHKLIAAIGKVGV